MAIPEDPTFDNAVKKVREGEKDAVASKLRRVLIQVRSHANKDTAK